MSRPPLDIGIAELTLPGQSQSGDRCVVKVAANRALLGVIDGLGHGPEAAHAADAAVGVLEAFAHESVGSLMRRCHERLRDTRGAAITLMAFDAEAGWLEWVGAGNVAAVLLHTEPSGSLTRKELLVRSGVAGAMLPSTEASRLGITRGDTVVVATDGVHPAFIDGVGCKEPPQLLADRLLAQYGTMQDDALVVVARLQGQGP